RMIEHARPATLPLAAAAILAATLAVVPGCGPPAPACMRASGPLASQASAAELPISQTSPEIAALAKRYEPTVKMSTLDRFWPVSVATVLQERDRRHAAAVELVSNGRVVADPPTLADLAPSDASSSYLDYPAALTDKAAQMRAFLRGVGV